MNTTNNQHEFSDMGFLINVKKEKVIDCYVYVLTGSDGGEIILGEHDFRVLKQFITKEVSR
jgi:hypothetical protein